MCSSDPLNLEPIINKKVREIQQIRKHKGKVSKKERNKMEKERKKRSGRNLGKSLKLILELKAVNSTTIGNISKCSLDYTSRNNEKVRNSFFNKIAERDLTYGEKLDLVFMDNRCEVLSKLVEMEGERFL